MNDIKSTAQLLSKLRNILLKQRLVMFTAGLFGTLAAILVISIVLSALANLMVLPVWLKISLVTLAGLITLGFFVRLAVNRLIRGDVESVAVRLEEKNKTLKGRLIAAVQFARSGEHRGYSRELVEATKLQALREAGTVNFNEIITFYPVFRSSRALIGSAVIAIALLILLPGFFSYSYEVYSNPTVEIAPPLAYQIAPSPTSSEWVRYKDIDIGASIFGQRLPKEAYIYHRLAGGQWQKNVIELDKIKRHVAEWGDSLSFAITLRQINKSFDFYVEAGRLKTDIQKINVVDRPRVKNIRLDVFYPDYTGLEPSTIKENNGSFSAVVGSRANLRIETNVPVSKAEMVFDDSSRTPLEIEDRQADVSLKIEKSQAYYFRLVDKLGEVNPDPIEYYITAVPDEYPSIEVVRPGFDVNLNEEMLLPLKVHIFDDYGFSSLVLKYTVFSQGRPSDESVAVIHFSDRIKTDGEVDFNWDLDQFNLFPGDFVSYYFEIADNDKISGPKITRSRQYIARLPSLEEIIAQSEKEGGERINQAEQLMKTGQDLSQRLKNIARKLDAQNQGMQKNQADWEHRKELEAIADKNSEMIDKIEKMAEDMDKSLDKMKDNALLSREIMEKMQEIQKLFQEVATPEMMEAQKKLMEALKNMDPKELEKAMKDFQMSQEELLQRLERTVSLLKKMQAQQKMEAMIRQVEELVKRQEDMNKQTDKAPSDNLPSMSKSEQDIKKSLQDLKKETEELDKMLKEAGMEKLNETQQFKEALKKTDADRNMQQMSDAMQQKQKPSASEEGKQALSKLTQMLNQMQTQLASLTGDKSDEIKKAMRRAIDDANYLSKKQEDQVKEAVTMTPQSVVMHEMARDQQDLIKSCLGLKNTVKELGKETPFVAAEIEMIINDAMKNMDESVNLLANKRAVQAAREQREAMSNLNKASMRLFESLEKQNQCDKGGSCNNPMPKLESLCKKQNQLNQQTQNMCNNPQPKQGQSQQYQQTLRKLAGEQGSIRKTMEELAREFGNSRQILGRLDDIGREMEKVQEDLDAGQVGQETTERQLRIYSRMLEATRSMQRRDFSEQRQAVSATQQPVYLPPTLSDDILNDRLKFEDKLREFLGDNYPAQYEEQIKAYFRALMQIESQPQNMNSREVQP